MQRIALPLPTPYDAIHSPSRAKRALPFPSPSNPYPCKAIHASQCSRCANQPMRTIAGATLVIHTGAMLCLRRFMPCLAIPMLCRPVCSKPSPLPSEVAPRNSIAHSCHSFPPLSWSPIAMLFRPLSQAISTAQPIIAFPGHCWQRTLCFAGASLSMQLHASLLAMPSKA